MKHIFFLPAVFALIFLSACSGRSAQALLKKASEQALSGRWADAETTVAKAVAREPENGNALLLHGLALEQCGKADEAYAEVRKAVSASPESFHAQYHLGRMLCGQGRYDSAIDPLRKAHSLRKEDCNTLILLAEACTKQNQFSEAMRCYGSLVRMPAFKTNPSVWNSIAFLYIAQNNLREAGNCFAYAGRLAPSNPVFVLNYGAFLDRYMHRKPEAVRNYRRYLVLTQNDPSAAGTRKAVQARIAVLR